MSEVFVLRIQDVSKTYEIGAERVTALSRISLGVRSGEFLAVMGPSGSGKTTLMNLLGGIDQPSSGSVFWRDSRIDNLSENDLNRLRQVHLGMVFQEACLMGGLTALQNAQLPLIIGDTPGDLERPRMLLEDLGLGNLLDRFPRQLSRGEKHRVAIARALVSRPLCLLADEPTGNLDRKATHDTFSIFRKLSREERLTVIVATHDEAVLDYADRRITLADGEIIEDVFLESREESRID